MKVLKNRSYVVAILVVIFIGIAGGFTNKERGNWTSNDTCLEDQILTMGAIEEYCVEYGGVWVAGEKYWKPSVKGTSSYRLYSDSRTVFDPKSTALFAIAGMIIFLVSKDTRGRKKTANDV